jgi:hypothetical protein
MTPLSLYSDVRFGRYKYREMKTLVVDRAYCRWLLHQPWFRAKWPEVYALVAAAWPVEELLREPLRSGKSFRRGDSFKRPGYRAAGRPRQLQPSELCLARTRAGGRCQRKKAPGKKRCIQHGGAARIGRPRGWGPHPNTTAGLKRWYQRMWDFKNAGVISRFPQGRRKRKATPAATPTEPPELPIALRLMAVGLRAKTEAQQQTRLAEEMQAFRKANREAQQWRTIDDLWLGRDPLGRSQPALQQPHSIISPSRRPLPHRQVR